MKSEKMLFQRNFKGENQMFKKKPSQSEIDGVQYRRAKLWQIIFCCCNSLLGSTVYMLIGMASYSASIGYGIATASIGIILTATRILDAITDPMVAFLYDRINTRFGKIRILMIGGFLIEALALWLMFDAMSSKGFGFLTFTLLYVIYIIGMTINNMTVQTINPILTNDPKQRPTLGVWNTIFNYLVPMAFNIVLNVILLPRFGGTYNQSFLTAAVRVVILVGALGTILASIGISAYDKPETFEGTKKNEPLKVKDMIEVLKGNRPLQCYIASAASDKIAQQVGSQSIVSTMLFGIIIGNMGLSTILGVIAMLPSIIFAAFGAKYAGKHGSKKGIVVWSAICIVIAIIMLIYFIVIDPTKIAAFGPIMIIYVILTLAFNGAKMCVSTCNVAFVSDVIDYELDRSGKFVPAVVTGTYSLLDKLISSCGALIASGAVALLGYTATVPQPGDACTMALFSMTMFLYFGLPIIGWIITLIAMRFCDLDKEKMVALQKRIAEKKAAAKAEIIAENLK
jgi:Na+/melibiose symporter-like transporter